MTKEVTESIEHLAKDTVNSLSIIVKSIAMKCPNCKGENWVNESYGECPGGIFKRCSTCNGIGKITQEEMIRQAQESIAKKELGKYQLVYKKDKRTIVAEPRGWKWTPNPKDICFDKDGNELIVVGINRRKLYLIAVSRVYEDDIDLDSKFVCPDELVPLIPWEEIQRVLEKLGFKCGLGGFDDTFPYSFYIKKEGMFCIEKNDESRQRSAMLAVKDLASRLTKEK